MMIKNIKVSQTKCILFGILVLSVCFSGCSYWNDFTTYFNLYYNSSRLFNETEQLITGQRKVLFTIQEVRPQGNISTNLTKVIEKLSKLLQFNSESAYMDDALLMIGKSFFYQQEYQKALRKFTELISTYPESNLTLETQLWIGKTQLRLKNFQQATATLEQVMATAEAEKENDILALTYIEQAGYMIYQNNYTEAISIAKKLIGISSDDNIRSYAMYETGQMYLQTDQLENAAKAFADVRNYSPGFELEYLSKIQYGKVQRRTGSNESALEIFRDIEADARYLTYIDSTKLQTGITLLELNRFDDAFSQFSIIDTTYRQSPNSGIARYYLGDIMENHYHDYDSASYYYSKASTSTAPPEFIQKSARKVQIFNKYKSFQQTITGLNKQLFYISNPEEFVKDSARYREEQVLRDSLKREKDKAVSAESNDVRNSGNPGRAPDSKPNETGINRNKNQNLPPVKPVITADSVNTLLVRNEYELGSLFFTELNVKDSAKYYYTDILENHSATVYTPRTLYALGVYYQTVNNKEKADSLFNEIYNKYPNESIVNAAAEKLGRPVINLKYDAAEELYIATEAKMKLNQFSEAISGFHQIFKMYPGSPFAPKALYAGGWIMENKLKLYDSAAVVYDSVAKKFPATQYAVAVKGKVQVYKDRQLRLKAVQDSIEASKRPKPKMPEKTDLPSGKLNVPKQKADSTVSNTSPIAEPDQTGNIPVANDVVQPRSIPDSTNAQKKNTLPVATPFMKKEPEPDSLRNQKVKAKAPEPPVNKENIK
ncbi:MAG: tetratricopeptide repeat protein [Ignavibacteria bacterium]